MYLQTLASLVLKTCILFKVELLFRNIHTKLKPVSFLDLRNLKQTHTPYTYLYIYIHGS